MILPILKSLIILDSNTEVHHLQSWSVFTFKWLTVDGINTRMDYKKNKMSTTSEMNGLLDSQFQKGKSYQGWCLWRGIKFLLLGMQ